jgi:2-hydroxy-3-keto-5-methylthiopentenyl-1-phosphate phosphatase
MPGVPSVVDVDLTRTSVFLDFDGTVTTVDSGQYLLGRLAGPEWIRFHDEYDAGTIGSRECLIEQWELVEPNEMLMREVAREVALDPGFASLVGALHAAGAAVTVVSDGFGFYAEEVCASVGVPVLTNTIDWSTGRLEFPHEDRCCPCSTCGVCKQAPIKDAKYQGRTTVLVGDGTSDRKAALLADVVFAKDTLRQWCEVNGVAHIPFENLGNVGAMLVPGFAEPPERMERSGSSGAGAEQ